MNFFEKEKLTALEAKEKAQWIAFAPVVFQVTRVMRDTGILTIISENPGITQKEVVEKSKISAYGVRVLVEASLGIGLLLENDGKYRTTKVASFILHDHLTQVNMDFIHDVCYNGLFYLEESVRNGRPEGLR